MAGVRKPPAPLPATVATNQSLSHVETAPDGRKIDTWGMSDEQRASYGLPTQAIAKATPDTYRMVDFVKAVAMRDDRGQEVRVQRIRLGAPVDRESPMKVSSIVLNGAWFDILTVLPQPDGKDNVVRSYRVHVTNVVSAER